MAPEIASWDPENSPGRPEAHPGRALALPAPREAPGSMRAAANRTLPDRTPVAGMIYFHGQPTSPQALENNSFTILLLLGALFLHDPTRPTGSADRASPAQARWAGLAELAAGWAGLGWAAGWLADLAG